VIRSKPSCEVYMRRGRIWDVRGKNKQAIADFTEAIRLEPRNKEAFILRGGAWTENECERAIADYSEAIDLDPKDGMIHYNRGVKWAEMKDFDKAIADYTEAILLDPNNGWNSRTIFCRANSWSKKKEYDKAIADYSESIRLDPTFWLGFNARGDVWKAKKDFEKAMADYNETIRLARPTSTTGPNSRAWLWATCPDPKYRDGKKAVDSALKVCEMSKWKAATHLGTLAAAYAESGEFDKAVEHQEKANKLYTDDGDKKKGEARIKLYKDKKPYRDFE
jgi:tetratricopeptide (TPR) repeat protein